MTIYVPKTIVPIIPTVKHPLLFLAGPIRDGGDWQGLMASFILDTLPKKPHIACPCRWTEEHMLSEHFHAPFSDAPNRQLHWERHYMEQAGLSVDPGCIIFWLGREDKKNPHPGPEPYAMDTRRELGKWTAFIKLLNARVVVGGDKRFYGLSVILDELSEASGKEFPFYDSMDELVGAAFANCS